LTDFHEANAILLLCHASGVTVILIAQTAIFRAKILGNQYKPLRWVLAFEFFSYLAEDTRLARL